MTVALAGVGVGGWVDGRSAIARLARPVPIAHLIRRPPEKSHCTTCFEQIRPIRAASGPCRAEVPEKTSGDAPRGL
jgi:hypothetical protein